ncbi:hypothetical protein EVB94_189 [Rhizobium phage RHph_TM40]|nr:hypothetical protein EVB94_189 [Rhizobium phage RHph_TM40]
MIILGAGLAGTLAGLINPQALILEGSKSVDDMRMHKAVLRFRDDKIGKLTGVPFTKIKVRKSIHIDNKDYLECTPRLANMYSKKVTEGYSDRSIWNLETSDRFIAPTNFHEILMSYCGDRIKFNHSVTAIKSDKIYAKDDVTIERDDTPIVSTLPMPLLGRVIGKPFDIKFESKQIKVSRYKVKGAKINQTIYFPGTETLAYRASMVQDILIIEKIEDDSGAINDRVDDAYIINAFGLDTLDVEFIEDASQLGKITAIDEKVRKNFIFNVTRDLNVYSLGKFALWKNHTLLDDVYDDIFKIKTYMSGTDYDRMKSSFGN